jgi:hypothetical protein
MRKELDLRPVAYLLIVIGIMLAGSSAVVPHFSAGYHMAFGVFLAGILPYVVYGALTEILRGWSLIVPGALIVAAHIWLTVSERYLGYDGYQSGAIYVVPIILAVVVLPVGVVAGRLLDRRSHASDKPSADPDEGQGHLEAKT